MEKEFAAQINMIADWIIETKRQALKVDAARRIPRYFLLGRWLS